MLYVVNINKISINRGHSLLGKKHYRWKFIEIRTLDNNNNNNKIK